MDRFETLLTNYLEGALSTAEYAELADLVRGELSCRKRFLFQTEMSGLLWALNAPATAGNQLINRTLNCLPGAAKADGTVAEVMELVRALPAKRPQQEPPVPMAETRGGRVPRGVLAAAAVTFVVAVAVWFFASGNVNPRSLASVATLKSFTGATELISPLTDERHPVTAGQPLLSMNGLETSGSATIHFRDGTTFVLTAGEYNARIWLRNMQPGRVSREAAFGKRVTVDLGSVHFTVTKQPANEPMIVITPHAEIQVIGTAFTVNVMPAETVVTVERGEVQVTRIEDRAIVSLKTSQCVSTQGDFIPAAAK
jgi:hypothetical protein